jgi:tagaturonate reductase
MSETPILQFGTSRFLLAHADLFISQSMETGDGRGPITVVQTTGNAESLRRVEALNAGVPYPVRIEGLRSGKPVRTTLEGRAIARAFSAGADWPAVRRAALAARIILSNTGDRGFDLDAADTADTLGDRSRAPASFPAKIAVLLLERFERVPAEPISLFPCELVSRNGDRLRELVLGIAREHRFPEAFFTYVEEKCHFANSLVDRIVSEPLEPVGAVAEPYALWAIERQDGLELPCRHPSIVVTDDLARYETLKLHVLNLGHTVLAEQWMKQGLGAEVTVLDMMNAPASRSVLETVWADEVIPAFACRGLEQEAASYVDEVRERFLNPFLRHRLSDIAKNHDEKIRRRIVPVIQMVPEGERTLPQPILRSIAGMQNVVHLD